MSRISKLLVTGFLALAVLAPIASAQRGRIFIGGGWGWGGPAFYGPAGWYGPGWGPYGYAYGYAPGPSTGSVKFDTKMKDAAVYVDGGYAGTVDQLKTFKLRPGMHNLELKTADGHSFYQERVNVVAGKTLKLTP